MTADERKGSFHHKRVGQRAAIVAAGPIANFILAIVIFTCLFTFFGKPSTTAKRRQRSGRQRAPRRPGSSSGDIIKAIDGKVTGSFSDMQRIVGTKAGEQLAFSVKRGEATVDAEGPRQNFASHEDSFGNVHRLGVLGITRATAVGEATTERVNPATAFVLGVKETWFVVDRTIAYIGGVFTGREAADQIGGPMRIAQISGQVATIGLTALIHLAAVLVDLDRPSEPVSGAASRWRSSFVLCRRSRSRASAVGARAGDGLPHWPRSGADVDGICDL